MHYISLALVTVDREELTVTLVRGEFPKDLLKSKICSLSISKISRMTLSNKALIDSLVTLMVFIPNFQRPCNYLGIRMPPGPSALRELINASSTPGTLMNIGLFSLLSWVLPNVFFFLSNSSRAPKSTAERFAAVASLRWPRRIDETSSLARHEWSTGRKSWFNFPDP